MDPHLLLPLLAAAAAVAILVVFALAFFRRSQADAARARPFSADPATFAKYSYGRIRERYLEALKQTGSTQALAIVLSVVAVLLAAAGLAMLAGTPRDNDAILAFLASGAGAGVLAVFAFVLAASNRRHLAVIIDTIRTDWRLNEAVRIAEEVSDPDVRMRLLAVLSLQLIGMNAMPSAVRDIVPQRTRSAAPASSPATVYGWRAYFRRSGRRGRRRIELEHDHFRHRAR